MLYTHPILLEILRLYLLLRHTIPNLPTAPSERVARGMIEDLNIYQLALMFLKTDRRPLAWAEFLPRARQTR